MAKAAAKGMVHVLAIIAVIIIVGGLAFVAYRKRDGITAACQKTCSDQCDAIHADLELEGRNVCKTGYCNWCCTKHADNPTSQTLLGCLRQNEA